MNTLYPTAPARMTLREHQEEARDAIVAAWDTHDSAQFISACGTGKTISSMEAALATGARTIAVFVPSIALVKQGVEAFLAQAGERRLNILAVCSDPKAATTNADDSEYDQPVVELAEIPVGTVAHTAADVADWLDATATEDGITVVFSTYDSSAHVVGAQHLAGRDAHVFDVAIMDEAHHLVNDKARETKGELVLDKADGRPRLRARRRLYATATPKTATARAKKQAAAAGRGIDSMDPTSDVFGPEAYRLTFGEAIARGILSDYSVHIVAMTAEHIDAVAQNHDTIDPATGVRVDVSMLIHREAVRQAQAQGARRIITFHRLRESAERFAGFLNQSPGLHPAEHVSSLQRPRHRAAAVRRLTRLDAGAPGRTLTNVRCLGEGVDVEALDAVVIIDPKWSTAEIVQVVGRVLRRDPDGIKTHGQVIIPVVIPKAAGDDTLTDDELAGLTDGSTNVFAPAMSVLRAMATQDDLVRHWLTEARVMAAAGKPIGSDRIISPAKTPGADRARTAESIIRIDVLGLNPAQTTQLIDSVRLVTAQSAVRTVPRRFMDMDSREKQELAMAGVIEHGEHASDLGSAERFLREKAPGIFAGGE